MIDCIMLDQNLGTVMSKRDKLTLLYSTLLLFAILAAGGYGLSRAYHYSEPPGHSSDGNSK
jgi:hypothetical protein